MRGSLRAELQWLYILFQKTLHYNYLMSFLIPALATLGTTVLPKAISWIGKKISGTFLGNAASSVIKQNP